MRSRRLTTDPEPCPYLEGRLQRLELTFAGEASPAQYESALAAGARRFGVTLFRPVCSACRACVPLRVPVSRFQPSRSQRRVRRRNADLDTEIGPPLVDDERLRLYTSFHEHRHRHRGWPKPRVDAIEYFFTFVENGAPTLEFRYRLDGRLVGVAYVDETPKAMNSVYAFFDPELPGRSLGTNDVLVEIEEARARGKDFLYLGYHVAGCSSMDYKRRFRPSEILVDGNWIPGPDRSAVSAGGG